MAGILKRLALSILIGFAICVPLVGADPTSPAPTATSSCGCDRLADRKQVALILVKLLKRLKAQDQIASVQDVRIQELERKVQGMQKQITILHAKIETLQPPTTFKLHRPRVETAKQLVPANGT